jgi:hypothetical protein
MSFMLNIIMLSVIVSIIMSNMLKVIMLDAAMLSVIMTNIVMLSVIILNVVAPSLQLIQNRPLLLFIELKELVVLALAQLPRQLVGEILLPSRRRFEVVQNVENFGVNRRRHARAGSALKLAVGIFPPFFQVDERYGRPAARPGANFIRTFFLCNLQI